MRGESLGACRLVERLGAGGMGTVYLGDLEGERVAVKVLHTHLVSQPGYIERFDREALVGQRVNHPNVVRTLSSGRATVEGEDRCYLVMEYVEGQTLRDLLERDGRLSDALLREIARQAVEGLKAIHDLNIVHRDVKPENLIITEDKTVKLMDLGLAHFDAGLQLSTTGQFVGSLYYAAPEQYRSDGRPPDGRTDLFSLGLVLHELAAGRHPFGKGEIGEVIERILQSEPPSLRDRNPAISPFLESVIFQLLSKDRANRFSSTAELRDLMRAGESSDWWQDRKPRARPPPIHRPPIPRITALYGREQELARLRRLFGRAMRGAGRVALVEGAVGSGKTRTVDELIATLVAERRDFTTLYGNYAPSGAATALQAFTRAFRRQLLAEGIETALPHHLRDAPALVKPFKALLRGEPPTAPDQTMTRDSIHTAFTRVLHSLAARKPTILFIDDLHFAPQEGLALFATLALAVREHPILLVGTMRHRLPDDWQGEMERLEHVHRVPLAPLSSEALELLVADALRTDSVATHLGTLVADRADGNPFFAFEILRGLREDGVLIRSESGTWETRGRIDEVPIPTTVSHLIAARLEALDDQDRELLELAACAGQEFDPLVISAALDIAPIRLLQRLGRIERSHGLVRSTGRRFTFDHMQIRETLRAGIPDALTEAYHGLLAETIEGQEKDHEKIVGAAAADLCSHHFLGPFPAKALPHLDRALDHIESIHDNERAIDLAQRALAFVGGVQDLDRVDLLLRLAMLLELTARFDEARTSIDEALGLADSLGHEERRARTRSRLGSLLRAAGDPEAAIEQLGEAVRIAHEAGSPVREADALLQLGNCLADLGRMDEAMEHLEKCVSLGAEADDARLLAASTGALGQIEWECGALEAAREHLEASLEGLASEGDRRNLAVVTGMLGLILSDLGLHEEAAEKHRDHLALASEIGYRRGEEMASSNLGNSLLNLGRFDEARHLFRKAGSICGEVGDGVGVASALVNEGLAQRRLGLLTEARETVDEALHLAREVDARQLEALAIHSLARVEEEEGHFRRAEALLAEVLAIQRDGANPGDLAYTLIDLGRMFLLADRPDEARELLTEAESMSLEHGYRRPLVIARCHLAGIGVGTAEAARSLDETGKSLTIGERIEAHFALWQALARPADLEASHELLEHLDENRGASRDAPHQESKLHREVRDAWKSRAVR